MSGIHLDVSRQDGLTLFRCRGEASLPAYRHVADRLRSEMAGAPKGARVYVDIVEVEGELEDLDKFSLGEYIAGTLVGLRIAVRMREGTITKFGENTAVNRGADILVSHDPAELMAWLEK